MADQTPNLPPTDDSADWEAIARFYAGESTPGESAAVRGWLQAHPAEAAALSSLGDATGSLSRATPPNLDVEGALRRVAERRDAADVVPLDPHRTARRTQPAESPARPWRRYALLAAAAVVLVVGGRLFWHSVRGAGYTTPSDAEARTFATNVGQRDSVRLPDGTRVVLAPETRLTIAAGYGRNVREVGLIGEAYFDVPHDTERPFFVRAGRAAIRDLGTTFTVRATGEQVRVAVTSGSVSLAPVLGDSAVLVVLRPGDAGTLGADDRARVERGGAAETDTAWTRGRLVFREAPVATVRAELRRWYGIDLQLDSSFASRHLSMTFDGESADRVLEVIALSLGAEVSRQGNTAVIRPGALRAR